MLWRNGQLDTRPLLVHAALDGVKEKRRQWLQQRGIADDVVWPGCCPRRVVESLSRRHITGVSEDEVAGAWATIEEDAWRVIEAHLADGAHVDETSKAGETPFEQACVWSMEVIAKRLLENNADVEELVAGRDCILPRLVEWADAELVGLLLDRNADANGWQGDHVRVLHLAARSGKLQTVELLLNRGADIAVLDGSGRSALHYAASAGRMEVAQLLLDRGSEVNLLSLDGMSPMHDASEAGYTGMTRLLLEHEADVNLRNQDEMTALHCAIRMGRAEVVALLVESGADIEAKDQFGLSPLHLAICTDNPDIAMFLMGCGADVAVVDKSGKSALHHAAEHNNIDIGSMLLEHGARVDTTDEDGMSVLHHAAKSGSAAFVSLLLEHGADFDAVDKSGMTAVHKAAENGNLHAIGLLVCRGADVGAKDEAGTTPLHHAANLLPQVGDSQHRMEEVIDLLLYLGAEISEIDNEGKEALHWAATHGFTRRCRLLLDKGARVNSRDARGMTPLHHAAHQGRIETVALLLERGADILATEENEMTALHLVASSTTETAELRDTFAHLLEKGADIQAVDQRHRNALDCILDLPNGSIKFFHADMVYLMCARGASLSVHPPTDLDAPDRLKMGLCAAIEYWQSCFLHGESLVEIPFEIIWSGSSGVETYVSAIKMCSQSDLTHRRKICIIGPSTWGKTSLVKSVAERMPALVDQSNRTIGIDLFPFAFVERYNDGEGHRVDRHEVTCWDFAGQDIYQVAHALFFSRRTLYLLCVDMSAYANALDEALSRSLREGEAYMQRFLEDHLLKWIRAILVRLPEAQFAVVGTKSDLIQDNNRLDALLLDLKLRFGIFTNEVAVQIQMSSAAQQLLKQSLAECHVTSVAHFDKVKHARAVIEHAIVARSELSFVMPPTYMKVLDRVHEIKRAAALSGTPRDHVNQVIMPMSVFCMRMAREIPEITPEECHQIVRTLDALGDVLWYEEEAKAFQDVVILDPTIMLDIVREVVNHNYESEEGGDYDALRRDGTLRHALLMNFPLWKALNETDSELVHLFKYLLQHFHLAYPAGNVEMHSEVDLIVPAYWKTRQNSQDDDVYKSFVRRRSMLKREKIVGSAIACWQYGFPAGVSETLYENFVVQSYRPMVPRAATAAGFTMTMEGEFAAAVSYVPAVLGLDVIRIEVAASTPLLAWQEVRFFVMAMEQLLERFPGLKGVRREIVEIGTNGDVSRSHSVGEAVKVLQDAASVGRDEAFVRAKMAWIPPAFSWFVESAWTDPAKLEEIKAREFIGQLQHKIAVLEKLVVTGDQERRLPALWAFTYSSDTKTGEIRMLSDVSGVCYHLPLDVKLPSAFISRHNAWLQDGVSLLSVVTSELLSLDIVKTAIEMIRGGKAIGVSGSHIRRLSALPTKADREERIHNLIDGLELVTEQVSSLGASQSPSNSRSLLLELLRIHDASFDELQIYDLANLRCAAAKSNGAFVWAHEREIEAMQEHLILCDPPFAGGQSSLPTSPCASSGSSSSSQCETIVSIRAISVLGLEPMDWYKVICEWQLIDRKGRVVGAQRTEQARATGTEPTWLTAPSELRTVRSARILRSSSLHVALRRPHRLSGFLTIRRQMKLLGTGSMTLGDCVPSNISKVDAIELHVPVGAGSVAFEISFVELSASGA